MRESGGDHAVAIINLFGTVNALSISQKHFSFFNKSYSVFFIFYLRDQMYSSRHPHPTISPSPPPPVVLPFRLPYPITPRRRNTHILLPRPSPLLPLTSCPPRASSYILFSSEMPRPNPPFPPAETRGMCKAERGGRGLGRGGRGENALELQGVTAGRARGPARSNTSRCYLLPLRYPATLRPL